MGMLSDLASPCDSQRVTFDLESFSDGATREGQRRYLDGPWSEVAAKARLAVLRQTRHDGHVGVREVDGSHDRLDDEAELVTVRLAYGWNVN